MKIVNFEAIPIALTRINTLNHGADIYNPQTFDYYP